MECKSLSARLQLGLLKRWLPWMVTSVILTSVGAYLLSGLQPKVYEATTTLVVGQSLSGANPDYNQLLVSQKLSATYARIATTQDILSRVVAKLRLPTTPAELSTRVVATGDPDTMLLTIACRAGDALGAAAVCDAIATTLIAESPGASGLPTGQLEIDQDLADIRSEILAARKVIDQLTAIENRAAAQEANLQRLQDRIVSLRSTYATLVSLSSNASSNLLSVVQTAIPPDAPSAPRPTLNALLAGMVAFLVVSAITFGFHRLDDRIKDSDGVQEAVGLPTLGSVGRMRGSKDRPAMYRLAALLYPRSAAAEAYRTLRTNVEFASVDRPIKSLLITSSITGEGKTITAANLAIAFAQAGRRVLLVDADLRRPAVHTLLQLPNSEGLTTLLRSTTASPEVMALATEQENLWALPAGPLPANPAEVLGSRRMATLVGRLSETFDVVIFDSPPIQGLADAPVLSSVLDGTVLVIDAGRTDRATVRHATEALAKASANVLGVVINRVSAQDFGDYETYYGVSPDDGVAAAIGPTRTA